MKHVEQDQYKDILMETIAYGSQVYNGEIPEDNRFSFDIDQLRPAIVQTTVENLGFAFVKDLKKTVENYGAWISLGVLVIETIKLLTTVVIFVFTFLREGIGGLKMIFLQLCCSKYTVAKMSIKRGERRRRKLQQEMEMIARDERVEESA